MKGSSDVSCTGLVSSSGNSTLINQQLKAAKDAEDAKAKKKLRIIIGTTVPLGLLLIAALGGLGFFLYRKRKRLQQEQVAEVFLTEPKPDVPITPNSYRSTTTHLGPTKNRSELDQHHPTSFISSAPGAMTSELGSPDRLSHSGVVTSDNGEELIIQHTDAAEVRELPPPYKANRVEGSSAA